MDVCLLAVVLGVLYWRTDEASGISAIQNRLGLFMLQALFLAFTSLSALPLFWLERPIYLHEVANKYYSPTAYYITKVGRE
jgi:hypothetical protein